MSYLRVLIHNAVPLVGVLFFEWSVFTLLSLFWSDAFLQALTDAVRIRVHRRLTNDPAHRTGWPDHSGRRFDWVSTPGGKGSYLSQHIRGSFSLLAVCAAGLVIAYVFLGDDFDVQDFAIGFAAAAVLAAIELANDVRSLGRRSFLWLQHRVGSVPTSLLFVTLLVGIPISIWFRTITAAFVVLVLLKMAADCGEVMYEDYRARLWPPGWDERPSPDL